MKISKGFILTLFLALFAFIELLIVIYDVFHPFKDRYSLDSYRVSITDREVQVPPFTFELSFSEYVYNVVNNVGEEVSSDLISDIYNTEKIIHPEKFADMEEYKEDELVLGQFEYDNSIEDKEEETEVILNATDSNKAKIAIVIDDMGISPQHTDEIISLKAPLTASFLTYGNAKKEVAEKAKKEAFEIMLHIPMMPHVQASLAPITLDTDMSDEEIQKKFTEMLNRYKGVDILGINNHMGSKFTEDEHAMGLIMAILKERNMYFLDSRTTPKTVGKKVAEKYGVPYISRVVEYGKITNLHGYRDKLIMATENIEEKEEFQYLIEDLFNEPVELCESFYEVTLSNSNPILHTGRLYSMWHDWDGTPFSKCNLFYHDWMTLHI